MRFTFFTTLFTLAMGAALLGSGCNVNAPAPPGGPVSFATQVQPIFDKHCVSCHKTGGLANAVGVAMLLDAAATPQSLVNQKSSLNDSLTLVTPSDATQSLLFKMVSQSSPPVGIRMPPLSAPLSSTDLGLIRDWINQGALDN